MTTGRPRHSELQSLVGTARGRAAIQAQADPVPDDVSGWLAGLQALEGIPFRYLVPDARMLPPESIRFFVVDPNWSAALTDGAISLAARTAAAAATVEAVRPVALVSARRTAARRLRTGAVRPRGMGGGGHPQDPPATAAAGAAPPTYSGFLLRSVAVADWPGLRVSAYSDPQAATPALPIARLERPAPTVLLALFSGFLQRADISKPGQHLHFGVVSMTPPAVSLRWVDPGRAGGQLPGDPTATVVCRADPARSVLDVSATVASIGAALAPAYQPAPVPSVGPAALSLQLLEATPTQSFQAAAPAPTAGVATRRPTG